MLLILTGVKRLSNLQILASVVLPILPLFLYVLQYIRGIWRASTERADLAKAIEAPLTGVYDPFTPRTFVCGRNDFLSFV